MEKYCEFKQMSTQKINFFTQSQKKNHQNCQLWMRHEFCLDGEQKCKFYQRIAKNSTFCQTMMEKMQISPKDHRKNANSVKNHEKNLYSGKGIMKKIHFVTELREKC